jgi:hypothetical protein
VNGADRIGFEAGDDNRPTGDTWATKVGFSIDFGRMVNPSSAA